MHDIVADRSSWAEKMTKFREKSMRVFFNSKNCGNMNILSKKNIMQMFVKKTVISYTGNTKVVTNNNNK